MKITYSKTWKTYQGEGDIKKQAPKSQYHAKDEKIVIPIQKDRISLKVETAGVRFNDYVAVLPSRIYIVGKATLPYLYDLIEVLNENKEEVNENE